MKFIPFCVKKFHAKRNFRIFVGITIIKHKTLHDMKTMYQAPESQMVKLTFEVTILSGSSKTIGGNTGSDMDTPDYDQNPF